MAYSPSFTSSKFVYSNLADADSNSVIAKLGGIVYSDRIVKILQNGDVVLADNPLDTFYGVSDASNITGKNISVTVSGVKYLELGGNVDLSGGSVRLTSDSVGRGVEAGIGDNVIGFALESGTIGDKIKILIGGGGGSGGGGSDANFVEVLTNVTSPHTVTHNLGKKPSVTVIDTSNNEIEIAVSYPNDNQVIIVFDTLTTLSGTVICN
jgi:hypothetical protein